MHILKFITEALNENNFTVAIFLGLQKAFDLVNHDIFLLKLKTAIGWSSGNMLRTHKYYYQL